MGLLDKAKAKRDGADAGSPPTSGEAKELSPPADKEIPKQVIADKPPPIKRDLLDDILSDKTPPKPPTMLCSSTVTISLEPSQAR